MSDSGGYGRSGRGGKGKGSKGREGERCFVLFLRIVNIVYLHVASLLGDRRGGMVRPGGPGGETSHTITRPLIAFEMFAFCLRLLAC